MTNFTNLEKRTLKLLTKEIAREQLRVAIKYNDQYFFIGKERISVSFVINCLRKWEAAHKEYNQTLVA